jgi:hypothetical protein
MGRLFCLAEGPRRAWGMIGVVDKATLDGEIADFVYDHRECLPHAVEFLLEIDPATDTILEQEEIEKLLQASIRLYDAFTDADRTMVWEEDFAEETFTAEDIAQFAQSLTRLCANALIRKRRLVCIGVWVQW